MVENGLHLHQRKPRKQRITMNWYYVRDGKQDGPHSEETMRELANSGLIDAETSVWREGMSGWLPAAQAAPHLLKAPTPTAPPLVGPGEAVCGECGGVFSLAEMVEIRGAKICARCKPLRLQKIQEGVTTGDRAAQLERLLKIAKAQRGVNIGILLIFLCYALILFGGFITPVGTGGAPSTAIAIVPLVAMVTLLGVMIFQIIYVYRLAAALQSGLPILWVLGVFFLSCIGLILLLVLSSKATKEIKAGGFKVGLLGGNPKEIEQAMAR